MPSSRALAPRKPTGEIRTYWQEVPTSVNRDNSLCKFGHRNTSNPETRLRPIPPAPTQGSPT